MQSNAFEGRLADAPKLNTNGSTPVCHFTLISNEYAGANRDLRVVRLRFTAFGKQAETLAENCFKGDQLMVIFRIENNDYEGQSGTVYGFNFVVDQFSFGAPGKERREAFSEAAESSARG